MARASGVVEMKKDQIEKLRSELKAIEHYQNMKLEDIAKTAEPIFANDHVCNSNLKDNVIVFKHPKTKQDVKISTQLEMIKYNDLTLNSLQNLNKEHEESKEQVSLRVEQNKATLDKIRNRVERRKYDKLTDQIDGFSNKL